MSSLYYILQEFLHHPHENIVTPKRIDSIRTVFPGAPGRISFIQSGSSGSSQRKKKVIQYNPADWPEEEDLPSSKKNNNRLDVQHKK